ncbi:hypothetical protein QZH41_018710 [Actinostola sp. cb2023]|nr:hypothetical protein QZH41_018710 [Actinostola sp. cb2023]
MGNRSKMAANLRRVAVEGRRFVQKWMFSGGTRSVFIQIRCLSNAQSSEETTHFGFETVTEEEKADKGLSWLVGDAQSLPVKDNSFDAYTIAFGIRNVTRIQEALEEAYRVLRPGGRFLCLEFSEVQNPVISSLYDKYSFNAIPVMGQVLAADWKSYQYLVESIRQFPNQDEFASMIEDAGFSHVSYENLNFGIAAIHSGFKL